MDILKQTSIKYSVKSLGIATLKRLFVVKSSDVKLSLHYTINVQGENGQWPRYIPFPLQSFVSAGFIVKKARITCKGFAMSPPVDRSYTSYSKHTTFSSNLRNSTLLLLYREYFSAITFTRGTSDIWMLRGESLWFGKVSSGTSQLFKYRFLIFHMTFAYEGNSVSTKFVKYLYVISRQLGQCQVWQILIRYNFFSLFWLGTLTIVMSAPS